MTILMSQFVMPRDTGLPEDVSINTFHWEVPGEPSEAHLGAIRDRVSQFYNDLPGTGLTPIRSMLATTIDHTQCRIKTYDLSDPLPRVPLDDRILPLSSVGGSAIPAEVSVVLSYQADLVSGELQARRRGRIFIGPLSDGFGSLDTGGFRPIAAVRTSLGAAAARLAGRSDEDTLAWVVYSRVNGTAALITRGWVDNAWDTQRRRGEGATIRSTWTAL